MLPAASMHTDKPDWEHSAHSLSVTVPRLSDWHFKDVLHFFKASVTNDKACIKTISEREVDGALIASMNDEEMEAALNISPIHVKKFKVKLKRLEEVFSKTLEDEELELKGENISFLCSTMTLYV